MDLERLTKDILEFNNSKPDEAKNIIPSDREYRGNQHDLDTFINTIQYIEYRLENSMMIACEIIPGSLEICSFRL